MDIWGDFSMIDLKDKSRELALILGTIMVSSGLKDFLPADIGPAGLIVGGIVVSAFAVSEKW
ncbi:hypothetical protein HNV12_06555 [Methanococcoides sp. SA1]|nr:hypothetical protein [Methanococcoides sp. SA1]